MNVPNHEKVPFKDMTPEERSAIVEAWLAGNAQMYWGYPDKWKDKIDDCIYTTTIYRTRQRQLVIPWEHIKPEYKWAVIGFDGAKGVALFVDEPSIGDDAWNFQSTMETIGALNIDISGIDWRYSLVQRPE